MIEFIAALIMAPLTVEQAQWSFSCPSDRIGVDGQILCSASHIGVPRLEVERTDQGMKLSTVSQCGFNDNPSAFSKYRYKKLTILIPLKPNITAGKIAEIFFRNLNDVPKISKKACGQEHGINEFELDKSQVPYMIDVVFFKKKWPY